MGINGRRKIVLDFHTKANCRLCDRLLGLMRPVLDGYRDDFDVEIRFVDITKDEELFKRFRYRIPVVMCEGEILFEGKPEADEVRAVLEEVLG